MVREGLAKGCGESELIEKVVCERIERFLAVRKRVSVLEVKKGGHTLGRVSVVRGSGKLRG